MLFGAPFAATRNEKMKIMIGLLELKKGDKFVDLGSGDGRIVIAAAKKGVEAHGYEINPVLVFISKYKIKHKNLSGNAFIHWKSYWNVNLNEYTAISVFGIKHIMPSLEKKLMAELRKGRIVSNHFKFPNWKVSKEKENLYLYKI